MCFCKVHGGKVLPVHECMCACRFVFQVVSDGEILMPDLRNSTDVMSAFDKLNFLGEEKQMLR